MAHKFGPREARASLFVRGVPFHIRRSQLEQVFAHHGEIRDVYIPLDYYTREPRGFAYVEFEDERDARYALKELDGARLWGQTIHIEWAKSDRKTPKEMRKQTGSETTSRPERGTHDRRGRNSGHDRDHHRPRGGNSYRGTNHHGPHGAGAQRDRERGRYGSFSRSPSRERQRGVRRRSRRSRSPSSSSFSSSFSDKKMTKGNTNGAVNDTKASRRRGRARNRSYSSSSYSTSRSRSRSRSYSSGSISSRSRSSSEESNKQIKVQNATTVTDLSSAPVTATDATNAVPSIPIQPDLPITMDQNTVQNVMKTEDDMDGLEKKRKHKKKHKHKHRHHRRHRHSDGSRRHKHKHRHKKRRKNKMDESTNDAVTQNMMPQNETLVVSNMDTNMETNMETNMNNTQ